MRTHDSGRQKGNSRETELNASTMSCVSRFARHDAVSKAINGGLPKRKLAHGAFLILVIGLLGCLRSSSNTQTVTLTVLDQAWFHKEAREWRERELQEFTRQTGIRVEVLPAPEGPTEQLGLWQELLQNKNLAPDIVGVDVIWPAVLADFLLDLKPHFEDSELSAIFPEVIAAYTINGKLVALPNRISAGLLFYRTDLLQRYGYESPPQTWDELEQMAARIQAGERASGNKNFWGFVWQGAPSEALTCNAIEWQASEGGGNIFQDAGLVNVNNPNTVRAWRRAARWVGWISPPGVVSYQEWDSLNIWRAGDAAFMRNWPFGFQVSRSSASIKNRFSTTILPRGRAGHMAALGVSGLGVVRDSPHSAQALQLVRFLSRKDLQIRRTVAHLGLPTLREVYDLPEARPSLSYFPNIRDGKLYGTVLRPTISAGKDYPRVSRTYFEAIHSVLTGQAQPEKALQDLQQRLAVTISNPEKRE